MRGASEGDKVSLSAGLKTTRPPLGVTGVFLAVALGACILWCSGCSEGGASERSPRTDLVEIAIDDDYSMERPAVWFPHDMHTEALAEEGEDCSTCHLRREDGYLSPLYKRLSDDVGDDLEDKNEDEGEEGDDDLEGAESQGAGDYEGDGSYDTDDVDADDLMELYHGECIDCHKEKAEAGAKSGPVTCGGCHSKDPSYVSSRELFGMDKSLHYRHSTARDEKCEDCHHIYDEEAGKLVYREGTESSCRDCHLKYTEENRISYRLAAHWDCIDCHIKTAESGPEVASGPRSCGGCHDPQKRLSIKVVADVPRLKRNQPDFVLLSAPEADLDLSGMWTVPFSHVSHEDFVSSCRVCHHRSLKACNECHTLRGSEESRGIMLQHAMHSMTSDHSCVGCHDAQKKKLECAGCHGLMEGGRLSEHACDICHAGPSRGDLERERERYTSLDDFRPDSSQVRLSFTVEEIPDSVVIGALSREYEPAVMPHRKIIDVLSRHIENSKVAIHFHGHEDVLCEGCHHHGSIGERPALCANCHGKPVDERNIHRPGLYAAYHRQCLGCHQFMAMEKPSECSGCHEKKEDVDLSDDILPGFVRE